ncbi:hypothetical protein FO519_006883 [Halicephalobus sp. NKZ332]|nr:hypothetical protein FO519_006883 [Halicephalobus sp. NKZ332]
MSERPEKRTREENGDDEVVAAKQSKAENGKEELEAVKEHKDLTIPQKNNSMVPENKDVTIPLKSLPYVFRKRMLELQPVSNALVLRQTCSICKRQKFPQAIIPILVFNKDTRLLPRSISTGINMSILNFIPGKEFTAYVWQKLTVVGPTEKDLEDLIRLITGPYEELVFNRCDCSNLKGLVTERVKQFTFTGALKSPGEVLDVFEAVKDVPSIIVNILCVPGEEHKYLKTRLAEWNRKRTFPGRFTSACIYYDNGLIYSFEDIGPIIVVSKIHSRHTGNGFSSIQEHKDDENDHQNHGHSGSNEKENSGSDEEEHSDSHSSNENGQEGSPEEPLSSENSDSESSSEVENPDQSKVVPPEENPDSESPSDAEDSSDQGTQEESLPSDNSDSESASEAENPDQSEAVPPEESNPEETPDSESPSDAEDPSEQGTQEEPLPSENSDSGSTSENQTLSQPEVGSPSESLPSETSNSGSSSSIQNPSRPDLISRGELLPSKDQGQPEVLLGEETQINPATVEDPVNENQKDTLLSDDTISMKRQTLKDPKVDTSKDSGVQKINTSKTATSEKAPVDKSGVNAQTEEEGIAADEEKAKILPGAESEIPEDERFPPEMVPEQPKDVLVKKQSSGKGSSATVTSQNKDAETSDSEDEEPVPEVDVDSENLKNLKSAAGGIAFDVPLETSVDGENNKEESDVSLIEEDPEVPEIVAPDVVLNEQQGQKKVSSDSGKVDEKVNLDAAYPSELEDDFSVNHETGLMPSGTNILSEEDSGNSGEFGKYGESEESNYDVLEKLRDEVDEANSEDYTAKESPEETDKVDTNSEEYLLQEELIDPIQDRRKFVVKRPSYRIFDPQENTVVKDIKKTLEKSSRKKRQILLDSSEEGFKRQKHIEEHDHNHEAAIQPLGVFPDFPAPKPFDFQENSETKPDPLLKALADAIDKATFEEDSATENNSGSEEKSEEHSGSGEKSEDKLRKDFENSKVQDKGPVMIEPESFYGQYPVDGVPLGVNPVDGVLPGPHSFEMIPPAPYYGPYEIPEKVMVETNQKLTVIYGSDSEETGDSGSEESEENSSQKDNDSRTPGKENKLDFHHPEISESKDEAPEAAGQTVFYHIEPGSPPMESESSLMKPGNSLEEASKIFSRNLVLTLSVSPRMVVILGALLVVMLLFKAFFMWYSPQKPRNEIKEVKEMPISIVTVEKKPLP